MAAERLTLRKINEALAARGAEERLAHGNGYFYFYGGEASGWYQSGVYVYRLNEFSLERWMREYELLKNNPMNMG